MGYRNAFEAGENLGVKVYLGMEIRFPQNDNDFLVYGISEEFLRSYPFLYRKNLEEFRDIANAHKLCIVQAHPFRPGCIPADPGLLDGVEIWNGNARHDSRNYKAIKWAEQHPMIKTVGSDFHQMDDLQLSRFETDSLPETSMELANILFKQKSVASCVQETPS